MKSKYKGGKHHLINPHTETRFKDRWGITAFDLAMVEGTTPDAINMRVHKFGTPFQRRSKFTWWEETFGKTLGELALERGVHPITITNRYKIYGSLDLPDGRLAREDLRNFTWQHEARNQRIMQPTVFTLEWALAELARINAQRR
jgi:hypothetical protein